jgi:hypothetical protein
MPEPAPLAESSQLLKNAPLMGFTAAPKSRIAEHARSRAQNQAACGTPSQANPRRKLSPAHRPWCSGIDFAGIPFLPFAPGPQGKILSMVLMLEIGRVDRFPTAEHLASYAGLVPRVHSSGGHTRMGQVCGNVNRNPKWAFVEAGNLIVISQQRLAGTHVVRKYQRIKRAKNHQKAVVAVARHLAEGAGWVLTKTGGLSRAPRSAAAGSFVDARVSADCATSHRG